MDFKFSLKKQLSKNESSYPVTLADVKKFCQFYIDNPSSTKYDSEINSIWIPAFVDDWESDTNFILLDTSITAYLPDIQTILKPYTDIAFQSLNIRAVSNFKYYPYNWNSSDAKTTLDSSLYLLSDEINTVSIKFNIKENSLPFSLYPKKNNLETTYTCGYADNDFTNTPKEIINAIAMQIAMYIDVNEGLICEGKYIPFIEKTYAKYTISNQIVVACN